MGEEDHRCKVPFPSHHMCVQRYMLSTWFMVIYVDRDHLAKVVFARFPYCRVSFEKECI